MLEAFIPLCRAHARLWGAGGDRKSILDAKPVLVLKHHISSKHTCAGARAGGRGAGALEGEGGGKRGGRCLPQGSDLCSSGPLRTQAPAGSPGLTTAVLLHGPALPVLHDAEQPCCNSSKADIWQMCVEDVWVHEAHSLQQTWQCCLSWQACRRLQPSWTCLESLGLNHLPWNRRSQILRLRPRHACASSSGERAHESGRQHSMPACAPPPAMPPPPSGSGATTDAPLGA